MSRLQMACAWMLVAVCAGGWDLQYRKNPDVEAGNQAFVAGKWDEAIARYRQAAHELGDEPGVHFDLGAALLSKGQALTAGKDRDEVLDTAAKELGIASDAPDTKLRAGAHYNLGNLEYGRQKYDHAIDEYKKALKLDPQDENARHNLEMALQQVQQKQQQQQQSGDDKKKKQQQQQQQAQQDQEKQDQQQDQDKQEQQKQDQQKQPNQDQQKQEEQAQNDQQKKQPDPNDKAVGQDQQQQQQKSDEQKKKEQQQQAQQDQDKQGQGKAGQKPEERPDDADRKLDALERRSKDLQVAQHRAHADTRRHDGPVKDW